MKRKREVDAVLAEVAGVEAAAILPEQDLVADLGIDSPKALRLLIELEDRLGVEIPDEEAARINTVGDIYDFIARCAG
jgi:acyl carrier protein